MYQNNYGYYPQAMQQQVQQPTMQSYASQMRMVSQGLKGRPVSSLDEARASTIDFDGSVTFFPDLANKRIYTKQINLDGTASLMMYELKDFPATPVATTDTSYVSKEEFQQTVSVLLNEINQLKGGTEVASDEQQQQPAKLQQSTPEFKF